MDAPPMELLGRERHLLHRTQTPEPCRIRLRVGNARPTPCRRPPGAGLRPGRVTAVPAIHDAHFAAYPAKANCF